GEDISGATGNTYTLIQADIANGISVTVTANNCLGSVSSAVTSPVEKASQAAPAAPVAESITATSITLAAITGAQYSVDRGPWQDSPVFNDLSPDTEYTFHAKLKESETHKESPASQAVISTNPAETAIPAVKDESTIELYPNPFTDKLYLKGAKGCTLRIYTPGGILVHIREVTASDEIVPLKHLRTGIYLFRLDKEGKTKTIWGIKSR
ncbi:MAG: T9SS type A sorting domain-containing protein, partial [Dysgonamonadaceae bacterium]|nr:T9SS type A sorting domain-containing protein [Dysgonamonadaceae bacterium]